MVSALGSTQEGGQLAGPGMNVSEGFLESLGEVTSEQRRSRPGLADKKDKKMGAPFRGE